VARAQEAAGVVAMPALASFFALLLLAVLYVRGYVRLRRGGGLSSDR
jgi:hypothetical protein